MQVVVPAAGEGTRLRPLTVDTPKGLVTVAGQPLLTHVFETARDARADELIVVIGYRGAQIRDHYGDRFHDIPITYVEQAAQRGLAHAVLQAAPYVTDQFIVLNGDNVFGGDDVARTIERARRDDVDGAVLIETAPRETAQTTGVVQTDGDRVTRLREKPKDPDSTLVTTGCYVLPAATFHACRLARPSDRGEYELADAIDLLVHAGYEFAPVHLHGWRVNVNRPADIETAEHRLRNDEW